MNDVGILRKIQNGEYDDEVDEYIYRSLNWYKQHFELLEECLPIDDEKKRACHQRVARSSLNDW